MSPPKIEGSPPNSLSPRPREQGPVSPMVPRGSEGSETPPKEASPGIVGTKREPPSDTESVAARSSRQRTEGSLRPDGRGAPGTSLAAGLKTPPASSGPARRSPPPLASAPFASSPLQADALRFRELHNHLNGVLGGDVLVQVLFDLKLGNQTSGADTLKIGQIFSAVRGGLVDAFEKKLSGPRSEKNAGTALESREERVREKQKSPQLNWVEKRDLDQRLALLKALEVGDTGSDESRIALIRHCLAAQDATPEGLPEVHFNSAYDARKGLWEEVGRQCRAVIPGSPPNEPELIGPTEMVGVIGDQLGQTEPFCAADGGVCVSAAEIDNLRKAFGGSTGVTHILVDVQRNQARTELDAKERPFVCVLRNLATMFPGSLKVEYTLLARKVLFFDQVFKTLHDKPNGLHEVQLQGKVDSSEVLSAVVGQLARNHELKVSWLSIVQHDMLRSDSPLPPKELDDALKRAFDAHKNTGDGVPYAGIDVAGPEVGRFDTNLVKRFMEQAVVHVQNMYVSPAASGREPFVVRVHAGETYALPSPTESSEQDLKNKAEERSGDGEHNCDAVIDAVAHVRSKPGFSDKVKQSLQVRIGHGIFLDTKRLREIADLDIILEFNPYSNSATAVDRDMVMRTFCRVLIWNSVEHAYFNAFPDERGDKTRPSQVLFSISTDGQGVMRTNLQENLDQALKQGDARVQQRVLRSSYQPSSNAFSSLLEHRLGLLHGDASSREFRIYLTEELKRFGPEMLSRADCLIGPEEVTSARTQSPLP
jgi:hypothetical protein